MLRSRRLIWFKQILKGAACLFNPQEWLCQWLVKCSLFCLFFQTHQWARDFLNTKANTMLCHPFFQLRSFFPRLAVALLLFYIDHLPSWYANSEHQFRSEATKSIRLCHCQRTGKDEQPSCSCNFPF